MKDIGVQVISFGKNPSSPLHAGEHAGNGSGAADPKFPAIGVCDWLPH